MTQRLSPYRYNKYLTRCSACSGLTTKAYARRHDGKCKSCFDPEHDDSTPSRDERILEHGYQAYAREEGHYE